MLKKTITATRQMEELMQDIKLNPKRYVHFSVFGKNPGPYEEPQYLKPERNVLHLSFEAYNLLRSWLEK